MNFYESKDVVICINRYDELLHKEEQLNTIKRLYTELSGYSFHDVVGHLFKEDAVVEADE